MNSCFYKNQKVKKVNVQKKEINTKYIFVYIYVCIIYVHVHIMCFIFLKCLRDTLIIINIIITQQPLTKSEFLMVDNEDTDEIDDGCGYLKRIHCTLNSAGYI